MAKGEFDMLYLCAGGGGAMIFLNLPNGQVLFFGKFKLQKDCNKFNSLNWYCRESSLLVALNIHSI